MSRMQHFLQFLKFVGGFAIIVALALFALKLTAVAG